MYKNFLTVVYNTVYSKGHDYPFKMLTTIAIAKYYHVIYNRLTPVKTNVFILGNKKIQMFHGWFVEAIHPLITHLDIAGNVCKLKEREERNTIIRANTFLNLPL